ncbi:ankyrin repeat domain-containing protein SOWAHA [Anolis carolinensis]|uniref:ankyrin repeat domain-containing protein SOWAHA n=1 Tax=Anolis carolinensis TaxID=28377 RepID=UPI002F2B2749
MGEAPPLSQGGVAGFLRDHDERARRGEEEKEEEGGPVAVVREQEGGLKKRFLLGGTLGTPGEGDVAEEEEGEGEVSEEEEDEEEEEEGAAAPEEAPPLLVSQLKSLFQGEHPEAPKLPQPRHALGAPEKPCMLPVRCPPPAPKSPAPKREAFLGLPGPSPSPGAPSPSPSPPRRALPRSPEGAEHEWLVRATAGEWSPQLHGLLLRDRSLANKGDFLTGFTVLHWAAKSGSCETLRKVLEVAGKGGGRVDVDARSHGGYTPLHIAALHGREEAVALLVREGGAQVGLRDYSGRRPYQYLRQGASFAARHLLRDPGLHAHAAHALAARKSPKVAASILSSTSTVLGLLSDDTAFYELTKGLKKPASFNKFLTAATAPRRKIKSRATFSSYSSLAEAAAEEEPEESAATTKRRPMSELFFGH